MIDNLILGFSAIMTINNIFYCFFGVFLGTIVGVIPGLGAVATLSLLLPFTHSMNDLTTALIMMSGIYYGSQYGGSTTAILLRLPGEISSIVSMKDGNELAKKGYAGAAIGVSAIGSFIGGCISIFFIIFLSPFLIKFSLLFGPREYFSLIIFGLVCSIVVSGQSLVKGLAMTSLGILFSMTGIDPASGKLRFVFNKWELSDGINFIPLCMGLFALSEILNILIYKKQSKNIVVEQIKIFSKKSWDQIKLTWSSIIRGSILGSLCGLIPGGGATLSSFISYAVEKKIAKDKDKFGKGDIRGLAGAETANNAGAQTSFIPMLSLGIPVNPVMVLMMATMLIHHVEPGPSIIDKNPTLFWGLIVSMWLGNLFLLIINLTTVSMMIKILKIPFYIIAMIVIAISFTTVFYLNNSFIDIAVLIFFGILGFFFKKWNFDYTPLILGFILGPKMEETFRQSMQIFNGNLFKLFESNFCIFLYLLTLIFLFVFYTKKYIKYRF